jgi:hypothetical protein
MEGHRLVDADEPLRTRSSTLVSVVALSLAFARVASGWSVHVTCADGGSMAVVRSRGHRGAFSGVCDLDASADGVCTFYSDRTVLKCRIAPGPGCQDVVEESPPPPCPYSSPPIAVPLRPHRRVTRAINVFRPGNPRYSPERLVLRCIRGQYETPSTTTTLPGFPDMTGDWVFEVHTLSSDCPGALVAFVGAPMLIEQNGTMIQGCRMGYLEFRGAALKGGFAFDPRGSFSVRPPGRPLYDLVSTIEGTVSSDGTIDVTEELDGHVSGATGSSCNVLWQGTMMPRIGHPCGDQSDCIQLEGPCSRCQDGICRVPPPFCRPTPSEPTRVDLGGVTSGTAAERPGR